MSDKEIDDVTGVETTGHVWDDDLRELNKPLPRWWLWTFYASIIFSIGYMIAYPAWPLLDGYTKGVLGFSQRAAVADEIAAGRAAQATFRDAIEKTPLGEIAQKPELLRFAMAGGGAAFAENCAPCHGRGAAGLPGGYPNLNDDDWLWGGKVDEIHKTILYGVRAAHDETRISAMPRYGLDELLEPQQISDAADYVLTLSGKPVNKDAAERGKVLFAEQCSACHGEDGKGNKELGAPNLTDAITLYGASRADILQSIRTGRGGMMPSWTGRLDPVTLKSLAVYVHSLGGGQ